MSEPITELALIITAFVLVAIASKQVGARWAHFGLPLITGFLFTGMLVGPFVLGFFKEPDLEYLRFIDSISLPFIAFAAGAELNLRQLQRNFWRIVVVISTIILTVLPVGTVAIILLSDLLPFAQQMSLKEIFGIALLGATIFIAKSPSSGIAVIKELRAKGSFTQLVLGVTVLMDSVVILLFAINGSIAHVLLEGASFSIGIVAVVLFEIALDLLTGLGVAFLLKGLMRLSFKPQVKCALIMAVGYCVFSFSSFLHHTEFSFLPITLFSEPLLICMIAGFYVANFTRYAAEFRKLIEDMALGVFVVFFTSIGIGLRLDVLGQALDALVVFALVRLATMFFGCWLAGTVSGNPARQNRLLGMGFVTQAGISLSLTKEVAAAFPLWGGDFATLFIGIIILNTFIGPSMFKAALHILGEARPRAEKGKPDAGRRMIIFGVEDQSLALARQLLSQGWKLIVADVDQNRLKALQDKKQEFETHLLSEISAESLRRIGADKAEAIVVMLDNDTSYAICETVYEHFGTEHIVVRLHGGGDIQRFYELGVLVVDPATAMVSLLSHYVRTPSAAALLLDQESHTSVLEVELRDPELHGMALRDLRLPNDILILAIRRGGQLLLSHGYTRLLLGDEVTVVGSTRSLDEVQLRFESDVESHALPSY